MRSFLSRTFYERSPSLAHPLSSTNLAQGFRVSPGGRAEAEALQSSRVSCSVQVQCGASPVGVGPSLTDTPLVSDSKLCRLGGPSYVYNTLSSCRRGAYCAQVTREA